MEDVNEIFSPRERFKIKCFIPMTDVFLKHIYRKWLMFIKILQTVSIFGYLNTAKEQQIYLQHVAHNISQITGEENQFPCYFSSSLPFHSLNLHAHHISLKENY